MRQRGTSAALKKKEEQYGPSKEVLFPLEKIIRRKIHKSVRTENDKIEAKSAELLIEANDRAKLEDDCPMNQEAIIKEEDQLEN